jgi:starch phosphorylase
VYDIPDEVIWTTHQQLKKRLFEFAHERLRSQRLRLGESPEKLRTAGALLDPEVLTIGFARRFATYKRATLLFSDPDRLLRLMNHSERPVQFVFAGKAHPKDEPGKRFIQEVYKFSRMPEFENRIVFLEDYDTYVGRRMYQGVDLWLNNPLRPLEASGTSGMKLPPNGGLNLSVLDGWWCEAFAQNRKAGWAIGEEIQDGSTEFQNEVDVASLFHILETQVVPLYYAKPDGRLPLAWIQLMRESIRSITPVFNTHRMVREYTERLYEPAAAAHSVLAASGGAKARALSEWKDMIRATWPTVKIDRVETDVTGQVQVAESIPVRAIVYLGALSPKDVQVQAYYGEEYNCEIRSPMTTNLDLSAKLDGGAFLYHGSVAASESGSYGLSVRIIPTHPNLTQAHELRLIRWAR